MATWSSDMFIQQLPRARCWGGPGGTAVHKDGPVPAPRVSQGRRLGKLLPALLTLHGQQSCLEHFDVRAIRNHVAPPFISQRRKGSPKKSANQPKAIKGKPSYLQTQRARLLL